MHTLEKGLSSAATAGIVIAIAIIAGIGIYLLAAPKSSPATTTISTFTVNMPAGVASNTSLNFQPATITVVIGVNNTIKWVNLDSVVHTVVSTSGPSSFGSSTTTIPSGGTYTITLTTAGTYKYECSLHPANMQGTIIVKSP